MLSQGVQPLLLQYEIDEVGDREQGLVSHGRNREGDHLADQCLERRGLADLGVKAGCPEHTGLAEGLEVESAGEDGGPEGLVEGVEEVMGEALLGEHRQDVSPDDGQPGVLPLEQARDHHPHDALVDGRLVLQLEQGLLDQRDQPARLHEVQLGVGCDLRHVVGQEAQVSVLEAVQGLQPQAVVQPGHLLAQVLEVEEADHEGRGEAQHGHLAVLPDQLCGRLDARVLGQLQQEVPGLSAHRQLLAVEQGQQLLKQGQPGHLRNQLPAAGDELEDGGAFLESLFLLQGGGPHRGIDGPKGLLEEAGSQPGLALQPRGGEGGLVVQAQAEEQEGQLEGHGLEQAGRGGRLHQLEEVEEDVLAVLVEGGAADDLREDRHEPVLGLAPGDQARRALQLHSQRVLPQTEAEEEGDLLLAVFRVQLEARRAAERGVGLARAVEALREQRAVGGPVQLHLAVARHHVEQSGSLPFVLHLNLIELLS